MSRLQDLIQRLCPEGVEFKPLGNVSTIKRGVRVVKQELEGIGEIPVYQNSLKALGFYSKSNVPAYKSFVIAAGAAGDIGFSDVPFWAADDCFVIIPCNGINDKYVYYCLQNNQSALRAQVRKASIPRLSRSVVEKLIIPVPPMEVQEEIVRILDTFSAHAAELQAELQARKEQYEYYRNLLLTFNPCACGCGTDGEQEIKGAAHGEFTPPHWLMNVNVEWRTMEEIGKFFGGLTGKSKSDFTDGNARFISYMNVYSNIAVNQTTDEFVHISENEKQNKIEFGDALFTGSSETPNECGMSAVVTKPPTEPLYLNSFCFGFRLDNKEMFAPDFLKHLLRSASIRKQIAKTANGVTRFNVSKTLFAKILLPIPEYELQIKIANILDRFEALVNDLTQGLPAEIAGVRERYEYYRDKLLTFKTLSA